MEKRILDDFLKNIKFLKTLTYSDLEGLVDGPDDVDGYSDNAITNSFDEVAQLLGWTMQELETWYGKNWT